MVINKKTQRIIADSTGQTVKQANNVFPLMVGTILSLNSFGFRREPSQYKSKVRPVKKATEIKRHYL